MIRLYFVRKYFGFYLINVLQENKSECKKINQMVNVVCGGEGQEGREGGRKREREK